MSRELARDVVPLPDGHVVEVSTVRLLPDRGGGWEIGLALFPGEWELIHGHNAQLTASVAVHHDMISALIAHHDIVDDIRRDRTWPQ